MESEVATPGRHRYFFGPLKNYFGPKEGQDISFEFNM